MYKVIYNNMVIDLLKKVCFVRYLKNAQRWITIDRQSAHGFMGSDNNTIYLFGDRKCPYPGELKKVELKEIGPEEYEALAIQFATQRKENEELRHELSDVREQLNEQNQLLQQILAKL